MNTIQASDKDIRTWDQRLSEQVSLAWENYKHVRIDLSIARLDQPLLIAGEFIYVEERSNVAAVAKIKLNRNTNDALDLEKGVEIYTVFKEVYITNNALQGEWLDLVFGINFVYKKKIAEQEMILFGGPGCVNVTPRFDFTAGQVWVLVDDVFVQYLVSGIEANIPLTAGQSIQYCASEWDSITRIDINGDNVIGDISGWVLPATLVTFSVYNTGVSGDISGWVLPATLVTFSVYTTGVSGDISGWVLPATLVTFYVYTTGVSGDISGWVWRPLIANFHTYNTLIDYDFPAGLFVGVTNALVKIDFDNCALTQAQVDNVLADLVASGITSVPNPKTLDLAGTNAAPSAAGLLNVAILVARGWTVTHS